MIFFWKPVPATARESCLSQWWPCEFSENGIAYSSAEQYMMYQKALLFKDEYYAEKILSSNDPKTIRRYGRAVQGFDPVVWDQYKTHIVLQGNFLKFSQNPELKEYLLSTGDEVLVEASPYDKIWGIGMDKNATGANDRKQWKGKNLLGFTLMTARYRLRNET